MRDPQVLVEQMNATQRRVWTDGRARGTFRQGFTRRIAQENRATVRAMLQNLAARHGARPREVRIGARLAETIQTAAEASAESLANTYDYGLARAILDLGQTDAAGEELPYEAYRAALFGDRPNATVAGGATWASIAGVSQTNRASLSETGLALALAVFLFYRRNAELDSQALLLPLTAACPICQDGIDHNPYPTMAALDAAGPWPAHPRCIHYGQVTTPRRAGEEVWLGD